MATTKIVTSGVYSTGSSYMWTTYTGSSYLEEIDYQQKKQKQTVKFTIQKPFGEEEVRFINGPKAMQKVSGV